MNIEWKIGKMFLCLFCAAAVLLFTSSCSPFFAASFWTDTNIYFTMGKGILHGLFPYRDLFDHKGPLLFYLYSIGALISENSFIGIFLMEILSLAGTCYLSYEINKVFINKKEVILSIPLTAVIVVSCTAFNQGGSAEEFCLPALTLAVYVFFSLMNSKYKNWHSYLFGVTAGYIFLIKYTICGLHLGLGLTAFIYLIWSQNIKTACLYIFRCGVGFFTVLFPMVLILLFSGILPACVQAYIFDNMNVYEGTPLSFTGHIYNALAYLRTQSVINPAVFFFAISGFMYSAFRAVGSRNQYVNVCQMIGYPVAAGVFLLFVYWGEMAHPYYALVFATLVCIGIAPIIELVSWIVEKVCWKPLFSICVICVFTAMIVISVFSSKILTMLDIKRTDMPQFKFAKIINEESDPTVLDVTSLDQGFYFAAGILPSCRYFSDNNLPSKEKEMEIKRYLSEGIPKFVVSIYREPGEKYELISEADGLFDLAVLRHYKLYRLIH